MPEASKSSSSTSSSSKDRYKKEKAEKEARKKYREKVQGPVTVEEVLEPGELGTEPWFKEGEWKPAWGNVEFVGWKLAPFLH